MTAIERVRACVERTTPDRTPYLRWDNFEKSDILAAWARPDNKPYQPRSTWTDEWGCGWATVDTTHGQIHTHPIQSADDYAEYRIPAPAIDLPALKANREEYPDRVCTGGTDFFFFERLEKVREFNEAMMDLAADRDRIDPFLDRLQEHYIGRVDLYAESGLVDCLCTNEDLGLQDRLTISPDMWRDVFKPRYKAVYDRAHEHGLLTFQHSCGYVQDIIPDLAEIGVDILELQQLACMDMDAVAQQRGNMVITAPVDIQAVLTKGNWQEIEAFQKRLFHTFDTPEGGYIPQLYGDMASLGIPADTVQRLETLIMELSRWRENPDIIK